MGKYTCVATNAVGEDDRIFTVNVHGMYLSYYPSEHGAELHTLYMES